jgi:hypothetical protein
MSTPSYSEVRLIAEPAERYDPPSSTISFEPLRIECASAVEPAPAAVERV